MHFRFSWFRARPTMRNTNSATEAKQHTNMYPKVMNQGSIMHPLVKAQHTLMIPAQNPGLVPDILSMFHIFFPFVMNVALNFLAQLYKTCLRTKVQILIVIFISIQNENIFFRMYNI
ncbi:hypothetical protein ACJX0J_036396, partial [Zea mays]